VARGIANLPWVSQHFIEDRGEIGEYHPMSFKLSLTATNDNVREGVVIEEPGNVIN
jgi:hypothetical protein